MGGIAAIAVAAIGLAIARRTAMSGSAPVVAIGHIADYRGEASDETCGPAHRHARHQSRSRVLAPRGQLGANARDARARAERR